MMSAFRALVQERTSRGMRIAFGVFLHERRLWQLHRREIRKVPRFLQSIPIRLNLGCGPNRKDGWINIDLFDSNADLRLDLREPWPFPENRVSYIYSEHVFEHFEFHQEVPHFLREALRVLEPGGVFDVVVPNTEDPLRAYGNPEANYWSTLATAWHPAWCQTELDHINYHFRQDGEHKYAWDAVTLARTLQAAGFASISRREFNPVLDTENRRIGSLYLLAKKPQS